MSSHHKESHFKDSVFLRDIVIGLSDGLTVPFALAAGLSGTVSSNAIIITAGIAEIVAGTISMGLGGYLAGKTEVEHYEGELKREYREIEDIPEEEKNEVRMALAQYGLSHEAKELIVKDLSKNKDHWVNFMMRFELGLEVPDHRQAGRSAFAVGGSYALGGIVPLVAYFMTKEPRDGLIYSTAMTLGALGVFGYAKSRMTGQPPFKGSARTIITGAFAAIAAYFIARLAKF